LACLATHFLWKDVSLYGIMLLLTPNPNMFWTPICLNFKSVHNDRWCTKFLRHKKLWLGLEATIWFKYKPPITRIFFYVHWNDNAIPQSM
jgi:hypothetical protein